jgi:2-phospho-L-lactate/phosphoenolpyruvate guanylyltransferase
MSAMRVDHAAGAPAPPTVLVPVKAFDRAKRRLAPALDPVARAALARQMADRVVAAAAPLPVTVVCDHREVAAWATGRGASVAWTPGRGLNGAVSAAVSDLAASGVRRVLVAHADLPLAHDLASVAGDSSDEGVVIVPDRHERGTNVIALPTVAGFRFAYGPGSFARHRTEARRLGLVVEVRRLPELMWDVDHPADLVHAGLPSVAEPCAPVRR